VRSDRKMPWACGWIQYRGASSCDARVGEFDRHM
jgi:hypothetical protein